MRRLILALVLATAGFQLAACGRSGDREEPRASDNRGEDRAEERYRRFVNDPSNDMADGLRPAYVDFWFEYPEDWREVVNRDTGNFVLLGLPGPNGNPLFTFAVGSLEVRGPITAEHNSLQLELDQFQERLGQSIDDLRVEWNDVRPLGRYRSASRGFTGTANGRPVMARLDLIVPPQGNGVTLITTVSEDFQGHPERAADIERLPAFRHLFETLRIGPDAGRTPRR